MSKVDTVIKNGRLVLPTAIIEGGIGIEDGKIVTIAKDVNLPQADEVIDAKGNFVMPGSFDAHVHYRYPASPKDENWQTGSQAAASGGVTTVLVMPVRASIREVVKEAKEKSIVDFGLYGGGLSGGPTNQENIDKILELRKDGVIAYKIFLAYGVPPDDGALFTYYETIKKTGLPVSMHAENPDIINILQKRLIDEGKMDMVAHQKSRPRWVETGAISKCLTLSRAAGCKLHIAHMSTKEGTSLIRMAKANNHSVSVETCPHFLLLKQKHLEKLGPYGKVTPPIRGTDSDANALWQGLVDGTIDLIATDHAPHPRERKDPGLENIFKSSPGAIGLQTALPLMLNQVNEGRISLVKLANLISTNPAKIFGLYPRKGAIQVGSDADLNLVDLHKELVIRDDEQYSNIDYTSYDGWNVKGVPTLTLLRGRIISREMKVIAKPGYGEWLKPSHQAE